jgi:lipoprotein-anchoring transpeptidase ErfK/SrfK
MPDSETAQLLNFDWHSWDDAEARVLADAHSAQAADASARIAAQVNDAKTPSLASTLNDWPNTTVQTTLASPAAWPPTDGKWIDVNLSKQRVTAYIGTKPVKTVIVSTGTRSHPTVVGTYRVYAKISKQRMTGGSRARGDYYSLPNVPNVMYFYQGYAIHGTYWHRNFGRPMSHGCVNLTLSDAKWFYDWTPMGTLVYSHY